MEGHGFCHPAEREIATLTVGIDSLHRGLLRFMICQSQKTDGLARALMNRAQHIKPRDMAKLFAHVLQCRLQSGDVRAMPEAIKCVHARLPQFKYRLFEIRRYLESMVTPLDKTQAEFELKTGLNLNSGLSHLPLLAPASSSVKKLACT